MISRISKIAFIASIGFVLLGHYAAQAYVLNATFLPNQHSAESGEHREDICEKIKSDHMPISIGFEILPKQEWCGNFETTRHYSLINPKIENQRERVSIFHEQLARSHLR